MKCFTRLLFLSFMFIGFSCTKSEKKIPNEKNISLKTVLKSSKLKLDQRGLSKAYVLIKTSHGNIKFKFYPKKAPSTVTRFMNLANKGFYNNLNFHRVVPEYLIQTGDPTGSGSGGSGQKLRAEFNSAQHIRGTVAMARLEGDIDSADSQFYIALKTLPHLDGKYTVFGQVTSGFEILDKIEQGDKILSISLVFPEN